MGTLPGWGGEYQGWPVPGTGQSMATVLRQRELSCLLFPAMQFLGFNEPGRLISQCQFMLISQRNQETDSSATWHMRGCTCVCKGVCTPGCIRGCVHVNKCL